MKNKVLGFMILSLCISCTDGNKGSTQFSNRNLAITVTGSRSFNSEIIHGRIAYYEISVTAPDIHIPLNQRISGDAPSATMLGIPVGEDRTIVIEAVNPNGLVIRRGKKEGVTIVAGHFSNIEIAMITVPIFTNVTDKSAVAAGRLAFDIFGEPGSSLEIEELEDEEVNPLPDKNTNKSLVITQPNEEGLFNFKPKTLDYGVHHFRVRDINTEASSMVAVTLYQQTIRPGIGVYSASGVGLTNKEMALYGSGQSYFRSMSKEKLDLSNASTLDVVDMLY